MAKKVNTNTNFDILKENKDIVTNLEKSVDRLKKEINRKKHISVLLTEEDFNYVHETCFKLGISKNEFYKMLLDSYRNKH